MSTPIVLAATLIGRAMNRRMQDNGFLRLVYVGLVAIGAALIAQSVLRPV